MAGLPELMLMMSVILRPRVAWMTNFMISSGLRFTSTGAPSSPSAPSSGGGKKYSYVMVSASWICAISSLAFSPTMSFSGLSMLVTITRMFEMSMIVVMTTSGIGGSASFSTPVPISSAKKSWVNVDICATVPITSASSSMNGASWL